MKVSRISFLLLLPLAALGMAAATTLPDACGPDKTTFDVSTEKNAPAPGDPAAGMAMVVFSESFSQNVGLCLGCKVTTRVGLDGAWVGANRGNSYFAVAVTPGEHHVCVGWQSVFGRLKKQVSMSSFTAEAGKVYYLDTKVKIISYGQHAGSEYELELAPLNTDEGRYRLKAWELATWPGKP